MISIYPDFNKKFEIEIRGKYLCEIQKKMLFVMEAIEQRKTLIWLNWVEIFNRGVNGLD